MGGGVAYGVTAQGEAYVLSAAAKNGRRGFEWKPVKRESVKTSLTAGFPLWLKEKRLTGRVPVDMLQSGVSQQLFEGRRQNLVDRFTEYARAGGPNIAVLWLVGLFAFLIALERFFVLLRRGGNDEAFTGRFIKLIKEGNATQARSMIDRSPSALARCLRLLWRERNESRPVAEKTLKEAFLKELPPLDRRLSLLAALAAAAPLLGLLGTVGGLITLFQVLNSAGTNDTKVLAGGISEALVNTLTGLAIAIPALVVHGYLSERSSFIQNSAQAACAEILNALWPASEAVVKGTAPHE
jgi:biopolymer transport protein ExbB